MADNLLLEKMFLEVEQIQKSWTGLTTRDGALLLLPDLDYTAQLIAIRHLLHRNRSVDRALQEKIEQLKHEAHRTAGYLSQQTTYEYIDHTDTSVYQSAAHSTAAVGMLAPFIESIFYRGFEGMGLKFTAAKVWPSKHLRWAAQSEKQWDCHFICRNGKYSKDVVKGIIQLTEATELISNFSSDLNQTIEALFEYRNAMFHNGFEWPRKERDDFEKLISEAGWPSDWFSRSLVDNCPKIFYMTDIFIQHCLRVIDSIINGMGAYYCERLSGL